MGKCISGIKEVRFVFQPEVTEVYILSDAQGDCPLGVQGWHHKTFPSSVSVVDILEENITRYVSWPLEAPGE